LIVIKLLSLEKKIKSVMNYAQNITISYLNDSKEHVKAESKDDDDIIKASIPEGSAFRSSRGIVVWSSN